MDATFILARQADLSTLVSLMQRLREDDPEEGAFDEQAAAAAIPALLSDPSLGRIWLISVDQEVAGYIALTLGYSLEFGGRIAFVDELFIERDFRRQGLGQLAMEFIQDMARKLSVQVLLLEVTSSNASAKTLYHKAGFVDRPHQLMTKRMDQQNS